MCIRDRTYLASIIDLPLPLNVTLHVQPIAQSEALALVKRQIDWMDKEIIDEQMSAVKTVSYTHLDVYKRQVPPSRGRRLPYEKTKGRAPMYLSLIHI